MDDSWKKNLSGLIKHLEGYRVDNARLHEFRRSLESCNKAKSDKVKPQLEDIYNRCKEHLDDPNFDSWFNQQHFGLKLGLKQITLSNSSNPEDFSKYLKWCFATWDPSLDVPRDDASTKSKLPISRKNMKKAMMKVHGMDTKQLSGMMNRIPQQQINALAENPMTEGFTNKLKEDKRAQAIAEKIKSINSSR